MNYRILQGDVIARLDELPANSFDACLTDPPYGLGFMGKTWDHGVPRPDVWAEVLRVLKPGAMMLAFGGTRTHHRLMCAVEDAGFEIHDCLMWVFGSGFPKAKSCLKPAWEPIVLARKKGKVLPLAIDECRIENGSRPFRVKHGGDDTEGTNCYGDGLSGGSHAEGSTETGRWPANVIHDGSEEVLACFPDAPGQLADISDTAPSPKTNGIYGAMRRSANEPSAGTRYTESGGTNFAMLPGARRQDSGSAARFFYCAKADSSERHASGNNTHPTVKPIDLCTWLAKLILPPEGRERSLLVPFSGSGSEVIGALRAGWESATGIEINPDYVELSRQRIAGDCPLFNTTETEVEKV